MASVVWKAPNNTDSQIPSKGPTLSPALKQREDKQLQEKQQGSAEAEPEEPSGSLSVPGIRDSSPLLQSVRPT